MSPFETKPKNYLKVTIYILTTVLDNEVVRKPFATKALAEEQYAEACANSPQANLQKLSVKGSPRGVAMAMYVLGQNKDVAKASEDVFGDYVDYVAFETVTEQVGAL